MNHLIEPSTPQEALDAVHQAISEKRTIIPAGNFKRLGDHRGWPENNDFISASKLTEVVEFNPDDLAIRIGAGATLMDLIDVLTGSNLVWPVGGSHLAQRSLGAILNEGLSGDESGQYGLMVDSLIGTEIISPTGKKIKSGGCVVKNASGYDFTRLCWRARGTLGFALNLTLKLMPAPESKFLFEVKLPDPALGADLAEKIILNKLGAQCIKLVHNDNWYLLIGLAGFTEIVELKRKKIDSLIKENGIYYEAFENPLFFSRPERVLCSSQTLMARGKRRNLLSLATQKNLSKATRYIELDISGACARFDPQLKDEFLNVLTPDTLEQTGSIYQCLKQTLDPGGIFFPQFLHQADKSDKNVRI